MDTQDDAELDYLQSGPASTSGRSDAEQLKSALMNEKAAPEILQFETDLVNRIEATMDYQACCEAGRVLGTQNQSPTASWHRLLRRPT